MTEEPLTRLFGNTTIVEGILWVIAAAAFITFLVWAWPKIYAAVITLNLIASLSTRLASLDEKLAALDGVPEKLERVRNQVENSHKTNLRDELDSRHSETLDLIRGLQKDVGRLDQRDINTGQKIGTVNQNIADVDKKLDDHITWSRSQEDRIDEIERTQDLNKETP